MRNDQLRRDEERKIERFREAMERDKDNPVKLDLKGFMELHFNEGTMSRMPTEFLERQAPQNPTCDS